MLVAEFQEGGQQTIVVRPHLEAVLREQGIGRLLIQRDRLDARPQTNGCGRELNRTGIVGELFP